jgi:hypothetical protein
MELPMIFAEIDLHSQAPAYSIGYLTLALINAGLAQGKNHSGLLWFLLSLCLGPIATFILVVFCRKIPDRDYFQPPTV